MILKILIFVVLSAGAVVSIYDPEYTQQTKAYRVEPYIAKALEQHHQQHGPLARQQPHRHIIHQHERHANIAFSGKDYANNIDNYYGGCPSGFTGQLSYPYDCRRFVNCWKGRAYIQTCGPGTVFNSETLECDSPSKVVCQGLDGLSKSHTTPENSQLGRIRTESERTTDYISCPIGYFGLLPHPRDCAKFLNCAGGSMHIQACAPETLFNPRTNVCDFAYKVECNFRTDVATDNNREGKGFKTSRRENHLGNQDVPSGKGWTNHHYHHRTGYHRGQEYPHGHHHSHQPQDGQHHWNCTNRYHNHQFLHHHHLHHHGHHQHTPQFLTTKTPPFYRDRWSAMNRTRPSPRPGRPAVNGTKSPPVLHLPGNQINNTDRWSMPSWTPIFYTPTISTTRRTTSTSTNSNVSPTTSPSSNYPNNNLGSKATRTNSSTTTTASTNIYYAQPVDDDQPSDEVFSNIFGGDINEISLPSNRRNSSRGTPLSNQPASHSDPKMDAINIPHLNLMPPYPSPSSEEGQYQIPEEYPPPTTKQYPLPTTTEYSSPTLSLPPVPESFIPTRNHNRNLFPSSSSLPSSDEGQYQIPEEYPLPTAKEHPFPVIPELSLPTTSEHSIPMDKRYPKTYVLEPSKPKIDDYSKSITMDHPESKSITFAKPTVTEPSDHRNIGFPTVENYPKFTNVEYYKPSIGDSQKPPDFHSRPANETSIYISPSHSADHPIIDAITIPTGQGTNFHTQLTSSAPRPSSTHPLHRGLSPGVTKPPSPIFEEENIPIDESNLYGGLLPPPRPSEKDVNDFTLPEPPSPPLSHLSPAQPATVATTTPSGVKTNVRVFQLYPPPTIQNATTKTHANPIYSPSYSAIAHSKNSTWLVRPSHEAPTTKTRQGITSPFQTPASPINSAPKNNFVPDIIYSHETGVQVPQGRKLPSSSTKTQVHEISPVSYNAEFYRQSIPPETNSEPIETTADDNTGQLLISEAIRLLLRPYFNRSGLVTDDMAANAESHIMNLVRSSTAHDTTNGTTSSTSTGPTTPTTTTTVIPELHKDVEIIFTGEQSSMVPNHHVHPSRESHSREFHRKHPDIPNPFQSELDDDDDVDYNRREGTTTWEPKTSIDDVCEFDCGDGKCIKTFETCDGVNDCSNRRDEQQCDHLGYEIRLSNEGYGRIEVKILGQWGYVCDDKFGIQDANVVCREVGFPLGASEVHGNSYYPPPDGEDISFVMDEVDCTGNETSLKDCQFMGWGVSDCGAEEIVGVQCKTPLMKCPNDYWLCSTSKECIPPAFVCDNVPDCSDKSDESHFVCNSTIEFRLRGGKTRNEGRLEVLYRGVWGTICDDDFGQLEAQVACNSLGLYGQAKLTKNAFGPGTGPIWLDQVSCYGNESSIDLCHHWSWGEHNCNHTEDISLKCASGSSTQRTTPKTPEDTQSITPDDIGMELYPLGRSSKFKNTRKMCGHFNANLTEPPSREFERVVKGNLAKRGQHPWQATIRTKGRGGISSHWCGAVLISRKHLLTAAHCLVGYPKGAYFIRLGDHYANIAESSEIDSYIENWYIHEQFREGTHMNNDIAIIVMKNPVQFNDYIQPICLPPEGTDYAEGRLCTISGWGSIQSGVSTPSNTLRAAQIPLISDESCKLPHVYGNSITEGMFCAGFLEEGVDACEGDSGGPFVCSDSDVETLYGIISWGQQCGHANKPGVYVKIEKYLHWIYEKIRYSLQQID